MSLARRVLVAALAVLPAGWGLCVTWAGRAVASGAETRVVEAPCRCCSPDPAPPEPKDVPHDCPGCGFKDAGRGVVRAEAVPDLPDADAYVAARTPVATAVAYEPTAEHGAGDAEVRTHGPPLRDRLASVVLLI